MCPSPMFSFLEHEPWQLPSLRGDWTPQLHRSWCSFTAVKFGKKNLKKICRCMDTHFQTDFMRIWLPANGKAGSSFCWYKTRYFVYFSTSNISYNFLLYSKNVFFLLASFYIHLSSQYSYFWMWCGKDCDQLFQVK